MSFHTTRKYKLSQWHPRHHEKAREMRPVFQSVARSANTHPGQYKDDQNFSSLFALCYETLSDHFISFHPRKVTYDPFF